MKIKENFSYFISRFRELKVPDLLIRLFLSWLLISVFHIAGSNVKFNDFEFFTGINLPLFIGSVFVLCLLLCLIKDKKYITWSLLAAAPIYAVLAAVGDSNFGFCVGLCAAIGVVVYYSDLSSIKLPMHKSVPWIVMAVSAMTITAFVGLICCLYYKNHWTPNYDFGLFAQMFENMRETGLPLITCERDRLLSHFAVHFSPVYYLLLPFYMLLPDHTTLLVASILIVASGAVPLLLICKRHHLSDTACCAFSVIYALYPCFAGGCFYYIHENNFLAPFLLWFIYFREKRMIVPQIIFMFLTLSVKEDAAVYLIIIALYFMVSVKKIKRDILFAVVPLIYFIVLMILLKEYGNGVMTGRYDNYIYDQSGSLITAVTAVIKNPVYVLSQCFTEKKLIFILKMLLPLAFLPLLTKKPARFILIIPFLLINLMTTYKYQYDIFYHYCFGSGALLMYLAVVNYSELKRPKLLLYSFFCSVIIFTGIFNPRNSYPNAYRQAQKERETIDRALEMVPKDESVAASTFLVANLFDHSELYELETTSQRPRYYVIDLRYTTQEVNIEDYFTDNYETVFFENNIIGVFMLKEETTADQ